MINGKDLVKYFSDVEGDYLTSEERAFCEGYYYAQKEFSNRETRSRNREIRAKNNYKRDRDAVFKDLANVSTKEALSGWTETHRPDGITVKEPKYTKRYVYDEDPNIHQRINRKTLGYNKKKEAFDTTKSARQLLEGTNVFGSKWSNLKNLKLMDDHASRIMYDHNIPYYEARDIVYRKSRGI